MRNRVRLWTALLALLALSLSVVEGVWASTCMVDGGAPHPSAHEQASGPHAAHSHDQSSAPADGERSPSDSPACPFATAMTGGCVVVSLPGERTEVPALAAADHFSVPSLSDRAVDLLLASPLFRPPQR